LTPARVCRNFSFLLGGVLGAGTGPRGGRDATRGNLELEAAVHRHTLDRVNAINDSLKKKKAMVMDVPSCWLRDSEQPEPAQPPVPIAIWPASQNGNSCISPTSTLAPAALEPKIALRPRTSRPHSSRTSLPSSTSMPNYIPTDGLCGIFSILVQSIWYRCVGMIFNRFFPNPPSMELEETQTKLQQTRDKIDQAKEKLTQSEKKLVQSQSKREISQDNLDQTETRLTESKKGIVIV